MARPALADQERLEPEVAWGTPMLLDTGYRARPTSPDHDSAPVEGLRMRTPNLP